MSQVCVKTTEKGFKCLQDWYNNNNTSWCECSIKEREALAKLFSDESFKAVRYKAVNAEPSSGIVILFWGSINWGVGYFTTIALKEALTQIEFEADCPWHLMCLNEAYELCDEELSDSAFDKIKPLSLGINHNAIGVGEPVVDVERLFS